MVVLMACDTERLARLLSPHVACVTYSKYEVADAACCAFTSRLYGSLVARDNGQALDLKSALDFARVQVNIERSSMRRNSDEYNIKWLCNSELWGKWCELQEQQEQQEQAAAAAAGGAAAARSNRIRRHSGTSGRPNQLSTRPIVVPPTRAALGQAAAPSSSSATATNSSESGSISVSTVMTVTIEGSLEGPPPFDRADFKASLAQELEMESEQFIVKQVKKRGRPNLHEVNSSGGQDLRILVDVDDEGYLRHESSEGSGSDTTELSDADRSARDGAITFAIQKALKPQRPAAEAIEIMWTASGSIIVGLQLDLPYALKLLELCNCHDPVLSKMNIVSCVLGEQRKAARAAQGQGQPVASIAHPEPAAVIEKEMEAAIQPEDAEQSQPLIGPSPQRSSSDTASVPGSVQRKLNQPSVQLNPDESIECLLDCIEYGVKQASRANGQQLVIVIGNTGAGKSTFINLLHGCELEMVKKADTTTKKLIVRVTEGSSLPELMTIGHTKQSETFTPVVKGAEGSIGPGFAFADCPGFLDNRGFEISARGPRDDSVVTILRTLPSQPPLPCPAPCVHTTTATPLDLAPPASQM